MAGINKIISIQISLKNPFEEKAKTEALKALAKLDNDALSKLEELSKSKVAVENLKCNFDMIKGFLGI